MTPEELVQWRNLPLETWTHEALRAEVIWLRRENTEVRQTVDALRAELTRLWGENVALQRKSPEEVK